jgi:hypothetical protein
MAVAYKKHEGQFCGNTEFVYVTKEAKESLDDVNIWYHLGGYDEEGDSYDTQEYEFENELKEFWNELIGPHESLRQKLLTEAWCLSKEHWTKLILTQEGSLEIFHKNGKRTYVPPAANG